MSAVACSRAIPPSPLHELTASNLRHEQRELHTHVDRLFAWILAIQFVSAVVYSLVVSPRTYEGARSQIHPHVWSALLIGSLLATPPILLALRRPGFASTRFVISVAQALYSVLLIHLSSGRVETHFHIFGSLAFLALYRDWRVLCSTSVLVTVYLLLRGVVLPLSSLGTSAEFEWRFLEHAGWVVFEDVFLVIACAHGVRDMRNMAARQAELELANARIERAATDIHHQSSVLNSVLTSMSDGLIVLDVSGEFLHFNPAAEAILGAGASQIPFRDWLELRQPCRENGVAYLREELPIYRSMHGETIDRETIQILRGGEEQRVWIEIGAKPLRDEQGDCIGGVCVIRDVTERKRTLDETLRAREEAERANRAKSDFLSRMSHELRTPMNAILGFGQLLKMDDLDEDKHESLDQIVRAGTHLLQLINEILDLSGIEAGRLSIAKESIHVPTVVREVVSLMQPLADGRGITIRFTAPSSVDAYAIADHRRLRQILLNLVSNAIKYNAENGEVTIWTERLDDLLVLRVQDTGAGIPASARDSLFLPFERLGAQHTEIEGTGLGLAHSKRLIEAMGGRIGFEPSEIGACFVVELPIAVNAASPEPFPELSGDGSASDVEVRRGTVLLIEEGRANIALIEKILRPHNEYRLFVARTGAEGLDLASAELPDVILLDMDLPDLSGTAMLRRLRENELARLTPIVVMSADATSASIDLRLSEGASAYMTKPIDIPTFLAELELWCQPQIEAFSEVRKVA